MSLATTTPGRSSITSSRSIRTPRRPEVFPGRGQPAHEAHPPRPRRHPAYHQPAAPRGGEGGDARPAVGRHASISAWVRRAGPAELHPFNIRVRDKRDRWEEAVKRDRADVHARRAGSSTASITIFRRATCPEAAAETASAALGRVLEHPDHRQGRRMGHGRAGLHLRLARCRAAWVHKYYNNLLQQLEQAHRLSEQSQRRDRLGLHVRADRRGGREPRPPAGRSSSSRCRITGGKASMRRAPATFGTNIRIGGRPEEKQALRNRADRLARNDPPEAAPVRGRAGRSGDPAQPGRQDQPPGHLRQRWSCSRREVMPEFHAAEAAHEAWKAEVLGARSCSRISTPATTSLCAPERAHRPADARAAQAAHGGERTAGQNGLKKKRPEPRSGGNAIRRVRPYGSRRWPA